MAKYIRYALASVCFAASVACLALWWRSNLHYQALQLPTLVAGIEVRGNTLEGMLNLFAREDDSVRTWKYTSSPVSQQAAAALAEPLEGRVFGLRKVGTTYWGFCPLWYPALIFALAGVGVIRFRRQFSIRSALVAFAIVAALLAKAMASRRYFRVSLRAMLVLLTLFCLWIGKESIEVRRENKAVAWVQQNGGQVEYDREPVPLWLQPLVGENFLRNVAKVMIRQRQLSDLAPLAAFGELSELRLIACDVNDLQPISGLTNLTYLQLNKNQIVDIYPLASLRNLETLNIQHNQVEDISTVQVFTKLTNLVIGDNRITILPPLRRLTQLEGIALHNLTIDDLSPLSDVKSLKVINGISKEERDKLRPSLPLLFPDIVRP